MNDINAEAVAKALNRLNHDIETSANRLLEGGVVELEGLDIKVQAMCEAIGQLPEDEARALETRLKTLIFGLDNLAEALKTQHVEAQVKGDDEGEEG